MISFPNDSSAFDRKAFAFMRLSLVRPTGARRARLIVFTYAFDRRSPPGRTDTRTPFDRIQRVSPISCPRAEPDCEVLQSPSVSFIDWFARHCVRAPRGDPPQAAPGLMRLGFQACKPGAESVALPLAFHVRPLDLWLTRSSLGSAVSLLSAPIDRKIRRARLDKMNSRCA